MGLFKKLFGDFNKILRNVYPYNTGIILKKS